MRRVKVSPRRNFNETLESLGFHFHSIGGEPYWDESAAYEFTAEEIDELEHATSALEELSVQAVKHIIEHRRYKELCIPKVAIDLIEASFQNDHKSLYGRFDLAYDGNSPPKLLEYNADTPTSLLEASVIQWQWLEDTKPHGDQFNSIHEKLIDAWKKIVDKNALLHFACFEESEEDHGTVSYLEDTAMRKVP